MANELATVYTASDGCEVELTPQTVMQYMLIGDQSIDQKEMASVIAKCRARKLNPLAGDAYITAFKGKASIIISRDYMNRAANSQDTFRGIKSGVITYRNDGNLDYKNGEFYMPQFEQVVGAWAEVYDSRFDVPIRSEISREEYDQHRNVWTSKPGTMCVKVAEMHSYRKAYPGSFGGLYDASEMPENQPQRQQPVNIQPEYVEPAPQQAQQPIQQPAENPVIAQRKEQLKGLIEQFASLQGREPREVWKEVVIPGDPSRDYKIMDEQTWVTYRGSICEGINALREAQIAYEGEYEG